MNIPLRISIPLLLVTLSIVFSAVNYVRVIPNTYQEVLEENRKELNLVMTVLANGTSALHKNKDREGIHAQLSHLKTNKGIKQAFIVDINNRILINTDAVDQNKNLSSYFPDISTQALELPSQKGIGNILLLFRIFLRQPYVQPSDKQYAPALKPSPPAYLAYHQAIFQPLFG